MFAKIHDLAYRWLGIRGNFYQIQHCKLSSFKGFTQADNTHLTTICAYEADFACTNFIIDTLFVRIRCAALFILDWLVNNPFSADSSGKLKNKISILIKTHDRARTPRISDDPIALASSLNLVLIRCEPARSRYLFQPLDPRLPKGEVSSVLYARGF